MRILITGAKGFVGRNLTEHLRFLGGHTLYLCDLDTPDSELAGWCRDADFVFHLAGVNRPENPEDFLSGNRDFPSVLLAHLEASGNTCPIMVSSSTQAALDNPYGRSKLAGERLFLSHAEKTGAQLYLFRFPNIFGKWSRPNYNSAVATFCYNTARGLPIRVNDRETILHLIYIDDVLSLLTGLLSGRCEREGNFCVPSPVHTAKLGRIADIILSFPEMRKDLSIPDLSDPLIRDLYATYLSFLPEDAFSYPLTTHADARGSFTEVIRTPERGQVSINISHPGITKGNHWHHTKNEKFLVVSGTGIIRFRRPDSEEILEYPVSGEHLTVVDIPTGYTHSIENTGDTDMVTLMWASECFDPDHPDTIPLAVLPESR